MKTGIKIIFNNMSIICHSEIYPECNEGPSEESQHQSGRLFVVADSDNIVNYIK